MTRHCFSPKDSDWKRRSFVTPFGPPLMRQTKVVGSDPFSGHPGAARGAITHDPDYQADVEGGPRASGQPQRQISRERAEKPSSARPPTALADWPLLDAVIKMYL